MRPRWQLPPPRELGWRLRAVAEAQTSQVRLPDGRREIRIRHQVLRGITRPMLAWWFQSFDRPCEFPAVDPDRSGSGPGSGSGPSGSGPGGSGPRVFREILAVAPDQ